MIAKCIDCGRLKEIWRENRCKKCYIKFLHQLHEEGKISRLAAWLWG